MHLFDLKLSMTFTWHLSLRVGGDLILSRVMMQEPLDPWDKSDVMLLLHALNLEEKTAIKGIGKF
jgi:hypothetical protein